MISLFFLNRRTPLTFDNAHHILRNLDRPQWYHGPDKTIGDVCFLLRPLIYVLLSTRFNFKMLRLSIKCGNSLILVACTATAVLRLIIACDFVFFLKGLIYYPIRLSNDTTALCGLCGTTELYTKPI